MRPALLLLALLLPGCTVVGASATFSSASCPAGLEAAQRAELFLGRGLKGGGEVSEAEVTAFMGEVMTPAFPDGLTVLPARGQWRAPDGRLARESSMVATVMLPGASGEAARARMAPVAAAWRSRFGQESVLMVLSPACIAF